MLQMIVVCGHLHDFQQIFLIAALDKAGLHNIRH